MSDSPSSVVAFAALQSCSWQQLEGLLEAAIAWRGQPIVEARLLRTFSDRLLAKYEGVLGENEEELPTTDEVGMGSLEKFISLIKHLPDERERSDNASKRFLLAAAFQYCQDQLPLEDRTVWRTRVINSLLSDHDLGISNVTLAIQPLLVAKPRLIRLVSEGEKVAGKQAQYQIVRAGLMRAIEISTELENRKLS